MKSNHVPISAGRCVTAERPGCFCAEGWLIHAARTAIPEVLELDPITRLTPGSGCPEGGGQARFQDNTHPQYTNSTHTKHQGEYTHNTVFI
eukprot:scaffold20268_cov111-Isochrysis_galbana.AAC.2